MSAPETVVAGTRTIHLSEDITHAIEERIRGTGFASVDAFVEFVLARLLEKPGEGVFSEEDERTLKERLRSLGYID
jgi:Arc/MetJ-type ribon-helix-helix transcriptional regulator